MSTPMPDPPVPMDSPFPDRTTEALYRIFEFAPDAILLVDGGGRIIKANAQTERMFGHPRRALLGQFIESLIPSRFSAHHLTHRAKYMNSPHARPMGVGLELFGRRQDGTEFPVDIMLSPLELDDEPIVLAVVRDATERRRIEAVAREARDMYLREIHHRVKNNLQVISSLLYLQTTYTSDPNTLAILNESQSRVRSIALIHEKLHGSTDVSRIDCSDYVGDLVNDLFRTYGMTKENIRVTTRVDDIRMTLDTAVPCGLILNELVSNVLKHAFPAGRGGEVEIALTSAPNDSYELTVRDDGVGLSEGFALTECASLGLKLVQDLTRQLDGTLSVDSPPGTTFTISFRELQYRDRH